MAAEPVHADDISGRWIGEWRSNRTGHHGQLRAIVTRHAEGAYTARYRARFWKIFAATYTVPLSVLMTNGHYAFKGSADLGWLGGGAYTYDGSATSNAFQSTYNSKRDHGTFLMHRPEADQ
ncbi:MAG: hypothetical protein L0Z53_15145 [Acidobacteriales bacterium]|nr:hypothetical protein [Terriglobales bacterium]